MVITMLPSYPLVGATSIEQQVLFLGSRSNFIILLREVLLNNIVVVVMYQRSVL